MTKIWHISNEHKKNIHVKYDLCIHFKFQTDGKHWFSIGTLCTIGSHVNRHNVNNRSSLWKRYKRYEINWKKNLIRKKCLLTRNYNKLITITTMHTIGVYCPVYRVYKAREVVFCDVKKKKNHLRKYYYTF